MNNNSIPTVMDSGAAAYPVRGAGVTPEAVRALCCVPDPRRQNEVFAEATSVLAENAWGKAVGIDALWKTAAFQREMDSEALTAIVSGKADVKDNAMSAFNDVVDRAVLEERGEKLQGLAKAFNREDEVNNLENRKDAEPKPFNPRPSGPV